MYYDVIRNTPGEFVKTKIVIHSRRSVRYNDVISKERKGKCI